VTYPTQNVSTDAFGTWPIIYEGIECPIGNYKLQYHFENVSTVVSFYIMVHRTYISILGISFAHWLLIAWARECTIAVFGPLI